MSENRLAISDVIETIHLSGASNMVGDNIGNFIDIEGYVETENKKKAAKELGDLINVTTDKAKRKELLQRLAELNANG